MKFRFLFISSSLPFTFIFPSLCEEKKERKEEEKEGGGENYMSSWKRGREKCQLQKRRECQERHYYTQRVLPSLKTNALVSRFFLFSLSSHSIHGDVRKCEPNKEHIKNRGRFINWFFLNKNKMEKLETRNERTLIHRALWSFISSWVHDWFCSLTWFSFTPFHYIHFMLVSILNYFFASSISFFISIPSILHPLCIKEREREREYHIEYPHEVSAALGSRTEKRWFR